ncbi:MAG: amidohydrolase family protein [Gemmatimonadaceae bacterium]
MRLTAPFASAVVFLTLTAAGLPASAQGSSGGFDLVIAGGRAIDPETGLDGVRWIGVRGGKIVAISRTPISGKQTLDAKGLVVSPGFIDLHAHGQQMAAARMQAFDGVTTALELEAGTLPVAMAYDQVEKEGRPINYGFSAAWLFGRIAEKEKMEPDGTISYFQRAQTKKGWQFTIASPEETQRIMGRVEQGLKEGALGIGVLAGYAPGYGHKEYYALAQLAKKYNVPTFTHVRYLSVIEPQSSFEAFQELVSLAATTGAHMHISHLNSNSTRDIPIIAEMIKGAQSRGVPVTTEAYPYAAGSTVVGAEIFRGNWRERMGGAKSSDIEVNGKPYNDSTLAEAQANAPGTWIVVHFMRPQENSADQRYLDQSVLFPGGAIASDAMPWTSGGKTITEDVWPLPADAFAHPRSAGTFTRFLRDYVRERKTLGLREGLRKMTLIPAQILEQHVPQMKTKGRLQVGSDADVIAFDFATVSDRATFTAPNATSTGMKYVVVNGTPVIRNGELVRDALPGRPVRRPITAR